MKRDMELVRKILFKIEEEYIFTSILNLQIEGYSKEEVAYHCKLLYEAGMLDYYNATNTLNGLYAFYVKGLTWEGHDFLDKIRQDTIWNKTKETMTKKGLPMIIDVIKDVATGIISSMTEGAINSLKNP